MADPEVTGGEAGAELTGTTASATNGQTDGQTVATDQTTVQGTGQGGESFFDYESIKGKPELEAAYKEMQGAFSRKTEALAKGKDKISQYDSFIANPIDTMRQLAQQHGYQLVQGQPQTDDGKPRTYNSWEEVEAAADERADRRAEARMAPMLNEMQTMKQQNVRQMLDHSYPDWTLYEDSMMENLGKYPNLVNDVDMLYRVSVPAGVLAARATKTALAKIQSTTGNTIQGQSTTTQQTTKKPVFKTISEAATWAAQQPEVKALKIG